MKKRAIGTFVSCAILMAFPADGSAQTLWGDDGKATITEDGDQTNPRVVLPAGGGSLVIWEDYRSATDWDVYATNLDSNGNRAQGFWFETGNAICVADGNQNNARLVADNAGGAIVTWQDDRSGTLDIYAQKIQVTGLVAWASNGIVIAGGASSQSAPGITTDGAGGAYITWVDDGSGDDDVYVAHVSTDGAVSPGLNMTEDVTLNQNEPSITSDGNGGAVIAWQDFRGGDWDIYAQRIDDQLQAQWGSQGSSVASVDKHQSAVAVGRTTGGEFIVAWADGRRYNSGLADVYTQRISPDGINLWEANGVQVWAAPNSDYTHHSISIVPDNLDGTILSFQVDYDTWNGGRDYVVIQRVDSGGVLQWNGLACVPLSPIGSYNYASSVNAVSDGTGGAVVSWILDGNVYAQKIDIEGDIHWSPNGELICSEGSDQNRVALGPDGAGGAVLAWADMRGSSGDIYVQRTHPLSGGLEPLGVMVPRQGTVNFRGNYFNTGLDQESFDATIEIFLPGATDPVFSYGPASLALFPGLTTRVYTVMVPGGAPMQPGYRIGLTVEEQGVVIATDQFEFQIIDAPSGMP